MKVFNCFAIGLLITTIFYSWSATAGQGEVCEGVWPAERTPEYRVPGTSEQPAIPVPTEGDIRTTLPPIQNGVRTFERGDYVIQASDINNELPFARYQTNGATTRLFVIGNLNLRYQQQGNNPLLLNFNSYSLGDFQPPENFMLVVIGELNVGRRVSISGYVYTTEGVTFDGQPGGGNEVLVSGAITSSGPIDTGVAQIEENYVAPPEGFDSGGFCEAVSEISKRSFYPLDLCFDDAPAIDLAQGNTGTPTNVTRDPSGVAGAAARFNGASSSIDIPAQTLNGLNDFTVSTWVNPEQSGSYRTILSGSNNDSTSLSSISQFEIYLTNQNILRVGFKGNYLRFGTSEPRISNNTWTSITVRKQGSQLCLFINGSQVNCQNLTDAGALRVQQAAIGSWRRTNSIRQDHFLGSIDELIIYDAALTASKISELHSRQQQGLNPDGSTRGDLCINECFADDFSMGLSDAWITSTSAGNFTPSVAAGTEVTPPRLRLTEDETNQSTAVTLQRIFPASNNRVVIEFDYYGWSPRFGNGADGVAVILSDASVTARPGSFGGSLGYAQRDNGDPGFAGGWIGIGIDEYGNYSQSNEGRVAGPGFRPNAVAIRGSQASGYRYLAGTAANLNPPLDVRSTSSPGPGHRYRIIVDTTGSGAQVSVERDTGAGYQSLIAPFNAEGFSNQGSPPAEMLLSFTGSTGASSNFHEIGNVSVCADEWYPVGSQIERFRIRHVQNGINCLAAEFEITACADSNCNTPYTDQPVTVTMSETQGDFIGGNTFTLQNGRGTYRIQNPTPNGTSQLQVLSSSPMGRPLSTDLCQAFDGSASNCDINFNAAGLLLSSSADSFADGINNQMAGVSFPTFLHVVDTNLDTLACEPRLVDDDMAVDFTVNCTNPAGCAGSNSTYGLDSQALDYDESTARFQGTLPIRFNGSQAELDAIYTDVGEISFSASLTLPPSDEPGAEGPELSLTTSTSFVVAPYRLTLEARDRDGAANPGTTDSGSGFVAAGDHFHLIVSSYNALGNLTPSFGRESTTQATSVLDDLIYPSGGNGSASLFSAGQFERHDPGRLRSTTATWEEAGTIQLAPAYSENSIYRFADTDMQAVGVGRFYPAYIRPAAGEDYFLDHRCLDGFSYMAQQDIEATFTLEATNVAGNRVTRNYGFTGNETYIARIGVAADSLPLSRVMHTPYHNWREGVLTVSPISEPAGLLGIDRADAPDGPLSPTLGLYLESSLDPLNFVEPDFLTFNSSDIANGIELGNVDVRYGRLQLIDIYGPEDEALPLIIQAEYWDEDRSSFVPNRDDSCTDIPIEAIRAEEATAAERGNNQLSQGREDSAQGPVWLPPNEPASFEFCLQVPVWLSWDNPSALTACDSESPTASATFGQFRGNDRIIFWLERGL